MKQARLKGHDLATVGVALRIDSDRKVYIASGSGSSYSYSSERA